MRLTDTHAHLSDPMFASDLDAVLEQARRAGVRKIVVVSENAKEARLCLALARRHPELLRAAVGLFPTELEPQALCDVAALIEAHADEWVAVGEVGLDHWKVQDEEGRALQRSQFSALVDLAIRHDLVLNVHSRSAGRATLELLLAKGAKRVQMHAFDGKASTAMLGIEAGYFFSIPPSVQRSPQKQKLLARLPIEQLLLESDSPVLGPDPAQRNVPANVSVSLQAIAQAKGLDVEAAAAVIEENVERLYRCR